MTSPRPGSRVSCRLDWVEFWRRYDDRTPELRAATNTYAYTWHISSRARAEIEALVESMMADREGSLSQ